MANEIRIGIWGGSGSGKTTFLAALDIALLKYARNTGTEWNIFGLDELHAHSATFLKNSTNDLKRGMFPPATTEAQPSTYAYEINGRLPTNRFWDRRKDVQFVLNIFDYPGDYILSKEADNPLWASLVQCQGLIYLFDPKKTEIGSDNYFCLKHSLDMMRGVFLKQNPNPFDLGRLPQHLAICITKFDDPEILDHLRSHNLIAIDGGDASFPPFIPQEQADKAFESLADDLTVEVVKGCFHKNRTQFFGTSNIGFYADPQTGKVDQNNPSNIKVERTEYRDGDGNTRDRELFKIKGRVNPIGVFEPLLWLHQALHARR